MVVGTEAELDGMEKVVVTTEGDPGDDIFDGAAG